MKSSSKSSVVTKTGDDGETGLLYGGRISKEHPQIDACGTVDEAVSMIGLARAQIENRRLNELLLKIQRELFAVGAELATDKNSRAKLQSHFVTVDSSFTARLEKIVADFESLVDLPPNFIVPGASIVSAHLDVARTVVRRAERQVVRLLHRRMVGNRELVRYLNRLSDTLFIMARYVDRDLAPEILTGLRKTDRMSDGRDGVQSKLRTV